MPGEDGSLAIAEIEAFAAQDILPAMRAVCDTAEIRIITEIAVPPLDDRNAAKAAEFVSAISGLNDTGVVSFGTDAGYFSDADYSTVVFGPGDISRAHKADEYIELKELAQGLDFLRKLTERLSN
ncbi:M20/M25/M40 family metallo-hydrolase [Roseovarius phycicola]|uniref:M20/M25/M40 family metallo-hydrolase n=1 Tax=Roseovarius phycicola TaxID=3080976 RepID=A0ABZ2HHS8_9RHOB